jgi:metal-responsive CopG/Arc/MetJ family transcriptional regulator
MWSLTMAAISIVLPDALANMSQAIAKKLHISRSQLIRVALEHEIQAFLKRQEQEALVESFNAMKKHKAYLIESEAIMSGLNTDYTDEGDEWWKA